MHPKLKTSIITSAALCLCFLISSCHRKVKPFADSFEQAVRDNLDFAKFDINKQDSRLDLLVASENGRHFFTRENIAEYIAHAKEKGEKYEPVDFRVVSKTESDTSRFASIVYEVTWNVSTGDAQHATHVVSHEIWERQIDGWHRLDAAIDSKIASSTSSSTTAAQTINATSDSTGQHPGLAVIKGAASILCVSATSDAPNPQPPPSCNINAPGFYGDVKRGITVGASGAGTVTLTCNGQGNRLACTARVQ